MISRKKGKDVKHDSTIVDLRKIWFQRLIVFSFGLTTVISLLVAFKLYERFLAIEGEDNMIESHQHVLVLRKSCARADSRMIMVAGLEGTGHHTLSNMFKVCVESRLGLKCDLETSISLYLFNGYKGKKIGGLFFALSMLNVGMSLSKLQSRFKILSTTKGDHLHLLGMEMITGTGMMSYPNFQNNDKVLNHPDLHALASMADTNGVDLRILVLQRSAKAIIQSTERRHFGTSTEPESSILIDNAAALFTDLSLIDGAFFYCVQFSELVRESWADMSPQKKYALQDFLHPRIINQNMLQSMVRAINISGQSSRHHQIVNSKFSPTELLGRRYDEKLLAAHNGLIASRCNGTSTFFGESFSGLHEVVTNVPISSSLSCVWPHCQHLRKQAKSLHRLIFFTGLLGSGIGGLAYDCRSSQECFIESSLTEHLLNITEARLFSKHREKVPVGSKSQQHLGDTKEKPAVGPTAPASVASSSQSVFRGLFAATDYENRGKNIQSAFDRLMKIRSANDSRLLLVAFTEGSPLHAHSLSQIDSNISKLFDRSNHTTARFMAFPSFRAEHSVNHPDLYGLALMAESASVDLRIVLIQRTATQIFSSLQRQQLLTINMRRMIIDNSAILYTQLVLLDPGFYRCLDLRDDVSTSVRRVIPIELINHIHPSIFDPELLTGEGGWQWTAQLQPSPVASGDSLKPLTNLSSARISPYESIRSHYGTNITATVASAHRRLQKGRRLQIQTKPAERMADRDLAEGDGAILQKDRPNFEGAHAYYKAELQARLNLIDDICLKAS